jgi:hypothetical protein
VASAHCHPGRGRAIASDASVRTVPTRSSRHTEVAGEIIRYLGALSILLVGVIHAQRARRHQGVSSAHPARGETSP